MQNFDLEISKYNAEELAQLFELPLVHTEADISRQQNIFLGKINSDSKLSTSMKQSFTDFLEKAKEVLVAQYPHHQHHLIKAEPARYVNSFPSNIFAGSLNPLKRRTLFQLFNVDSCDFTVVNNKLSFDVQTPFKNVVKMTLLTFQAVEQPASGGYCFLAVNDSNNNVNATIVTTNSSLMANNLLARISFPDMLPPVVIHTPREYFGPVNITKLEVQLLNADGTPTITIQNFNFCLEFEILYDL